MNNLEASVLSLVSVVLLSLSSLAGCAVDANGEETARDESAIGTQESALKKLDPCSGSIFNCEEPTGDGSGGGGPGDPHTTPPTWLIQQCATEHNECRTDCPTCFARVERRDSTTTTRRRRKRHRRAVPRCGSRHAPPRENELPRGDESTTRVAKENKGKRARPCTIRRGGHG